MSQGDLYVGYLPLPAKHRRTVRLAVATIALALLLASAGIAALQRDPGPAVWDTTREQTFTGLVLANPYPALETSDGTYLVVEMGKRGAQERLGPLHTQTARLTGFVLEREGRRMIELAPDPSAVTPLDERRTSDTTLFVGEEITLTGEILDAKCYLGAMKPGDGKAHKACATLCIDGGIPPMLYATRADGSKGYYVLTARDATPAPGLVRDYLAEPVRVRGTPFISDSGLSLLMIDEYSIRRVNP